MLSILTLRPLPDLALLKEGYKGVGVASIKTALKSNYSAVKNGTCQ